MTLSASLFELGFQGSPRYAIAHIFVERSEAPFKLRLLGTSQKKFPLLKKEGLGATH
jgi:hypothetical protein